MFNRSIIFGNSGAGKSTLAQQLANGQWPERLATAFAASDIDNTDVKSSSAKILAEQHIQRAHLDLDTIAWLVDEQTQQPIRKPIAQASEEIAEFIKQNDHWVIEGCYADLLAIAARYADSAVYLNLTIEQCVDNAKQRPWEPHKYPSKEAQDANLAMLINWIRDYQTREDSFSLNAHQTLFESFNGHKVMLQNN